MTADELRREAGMVMASFKTQIESDINPGLVVMMHWPLTLHSPHPVATPGEWSRIPGMDAAGPLLDVGPAKTVLFEVFRRVVQETRADGVIFATDAWRGKATEEGLKHMDEFAAETNRGFERLVQLGWVMREETIIVTAQSERDVVTMSQAYRQRRTGPEWIGELDVHIGSQEHFGGRQKMFGKFDASTLGEPPAGSYAGRHNKGRRISGKSQPPQT